MGDFNDTTPSLPLDDHIETEIPALVAMTVYLLFLAITGLAGNLLVIISVAISPRLRTTSFAFVFNLSVADLMVNVLVIPLIIKSFFDYGWPHNPLGCRLVFYILAFAVGNSLITLTAIAASRYCFVSRPRRTYNIFCGWKAVILILIYNYLSGVTFILITELANICTIRYLPDIRFCYLDNDLATFWYINGILFYGALTCFLLIPLLYCQTFRTVRQSKHRVWAARVAQQPTVALYGGRPPVVHPAEIRLTKMMLLIFILLLICWTPISVLHFFKHRFSIPKSIHRLCIMLVLTNSSINPYVYAWFNKNFLHAYKRILHLDQCTRSHSQ
ncbi:melatonin receptor type 1A-like [Patiria miniata]|uniref:G-protein coupled receptors family 1 profile domain-containing protein n=1 Tax=Patiria miniata TaxID=46514 RepID=A0A914AJY3_PATMI|nr:melatonin receptor type 1A-like [Patiria miniata]